MFDVGRKNNADVVGVLEDLNWKGAIKALITMGEITLPDFPDSGTFELMKNHPFHGDGLGKMKEFLKLIYTNSPPLVIDDEADFWDAVGALLAAMHRAIELKLVVTSPDVIFAKDKGLFERYSLTEKGLSVALKLQEHEDNERRHNTTASNSNRAFWISVVALVFAAGSMWMSYKRLNIYESEVQKVKANQTSINNSNSPKSKLQEQSR
tara:strand:+ start:517 stop:1143 length:627 start_codon:yes stop_codon:yes gene_type:complete